MKNSMMLLFLGCLSTIFTSTVLAQNFGRSTGMSDFNERPTLGFKVGTNLSNVYDTQGEEFEADPKFGLATGLFLAVPLGQYLGIQPEILFSQKGYRGSGSVLGSEYSFKRSTNYIDVPLLLALKPTQYFTFLVGPQYSFLLSQKYTFKSDILDISREEQFDNENLRKNTLGFTGGFDVTMESAVLSARAGWDILSNEGDGTSNSPRYKNMWYQATIGFRF